MEKMQVKVNIVNVIIAVIYIVFFFAYSEIESIYHYYPGIWRNLSRIEMMSFAVIPFLALLYLQKEFLTNRLFVILIGLYTGMLMLSTIIADGQIGNCFNYVAKLICFLLLVALVIKRNSKMFIWLTLIMLWGFALINLMTVLQNPNGMYFSEMSDGSINKWNWFLGYKNSFIRFYLPATFLGCVYQKLIRSAKFTIINYTMIVIMVISLYLVNAATSYVGIAGILIFTIFSEVIANWGKITGVVYYVINGLMFFLLIIGNRINPLVAYFVVYVLNKNLTFSSRRNIWDLTIESIRNHPLFGMGVQKGTDVAGIIGMQHSHNMYLWHAFRGGIPYLILFAIIIFLVLAYAGKSRNPVVAQISMFTFFVLMTMWQFEVFGDSIFLFSMVYLVWHIDVLEADIMEVQHKKKRKIRIRMPWQKKQETSNNRIRIAL